VVRGFARAQKRLPIAEPIEDASTLFGVHGSDASIAPSAGADAAPKLTVARTAIAIQLEPLIVRAPT